MNDRPRRKFGLLSVIVVGLLAIVMVILATRRDRVFKPGQTIQYDDFFFTLRGVNRSPVATSGGDGRSASMVEYGVKLTIDNRAKRVPFRFTNGSVALFDPADGKRYLVDPEAQRAYMKATGQDPPDPLVLKAGESVTRDYVFRLPAGVTDPRLRVAPGGWSGLDLDKLLFGIKEFQLPVNEASLP
jgi:hypothetical protein